MLDAILVGWTSKNSNNVGARSVSAALYNVRKKHPSRECQALTAYQMCVQLGSVISAYIYVDSDSPLYRRGNTVLVIINIMVIAVFVLTKVYYVWRNKQRERVWNAMTHDEQNDYVKNTRVSGSRRLDFRFAH